MSIARSHPGARGPWGKARARDNRLRDTKEMVKRSEQLLVPSRSDSASWQDPAVGEQKRAGAWPVRAAEWRAGADGDSRLVVGARAAAAVAGGCLCLRVLADPARWLVAATPPTDASRVGKAVARGARMAPRFVRVLATLETRGAWSASGSAAHGMRVCIFLHLCGNLHFSALVRKLAIFCTGAKTCIFLHSCVR